MRWRWSSAARAWLRPARWSSTSRCRSFLERDRAPVAQRHRHGAGEDDPPLVGAVQGVAGGQDQLRIADVLRDACPRALPSDDTVVGDPVLERGVRHPKMDVVAVPNRVDMPEPGSEGRPVPRDANRALLPGQRRLRIVARALVQRAEAARALAEEYGQAGSRRAEDC